MTNAKNIIAITSNENIPLAGRMVWWRMSGAVDAAEWKQVAQDAGLDPDFIPDPPSPSTALHRACSEHKGPRQLVRSLEAGEGWAIVNEKVRGRELEHDITVRAKINLLGELTVEADNAADPAKADRIKAAIEVAYRRYLHELVGNDCASWLTSVLMPKVDGITLRDTGGIYFIPAEHLAIWDKWTATLAECSSHRIIQVPAVTAEQTFDAVLDAVHIEAEQVVKTMTEALEADKLGERGFASQARNCQALKDKVERYEERIGKALPDLQEQLESLRAQLTVASLKKAGTKTSKAFAGLADL